LSEEDFMMRVRAIVAVAALAASVACSNTPTGPNIITASSAVVQGFIAQFATVGPPPVSGALHGGTVSLAPGGPTVTPTGPTAAVQGGAVIVSLQATSAFQHAFVSITNTGQPIPANGFYEIDLPAPVTTLQVLVTFAATWPTGITTFGLQFQVTDANGLGGSTGAITMTASASVAGSKPSVLASYNPNPAAFLGGTACTLSLQQGCLWEFDVVLQEVNGVGVVSVAMNETFTFGATTVTGSLNIQIPAHGTATITRNFACGAGGTACATPAELGGGTYTYTLTGTDTNGNAFSFTGPVLTLSGQ
jgi:hypothetical protein